jgi:CBS domain-containing protein
MTCQELMTSMPTCCQGNHTLTEVATMMKRDDVGAIPVTDGDASTLVGVVTDRDIVIKAVAEGLDPAQTAVASVMSEDPVCCSQDDPVERALDLMTIHQIRRIPVIGTQGEIVGIISQADVAIRLRDPEETGEVVEAISQSDTESR